MPLENALRHDLLPALTCRSSFTDQERELFALPTRLGGLGIPDLTRTASCLFDRSQQVTAPLTALSLQQDLSYPYASRVENEQTNAMNKKRLSDTLNRLMRLPSYVRTSPLICSDQWTLGVRRMRPVVWECYL